MLTRLGIKFDDMDEGDQIFVEWDGLVVAGTFDGFERHNGHSCLRLLRDAKPDPCTVWHIPAREITAITMGLKRHPHEDLTVGGRVLARIWRGEGRVVR